MDSHKKPFRVYLPLEMNQSFGPEVVLGVARYAASAGKKWLLSVSDWGEPMPSPESAGGLGAGWRGVIGRVRTRQQEDAWLASGLPVVNVSGVLRGSRLPRVQTDDRAAGALAAEHLLGRGYRRFAVATIAGQVWRDRAAAFARRVCRQGHRCSRLNLGDVTPAQHERLIPRLADWLARLPEATGVLAVSDLLGRRLSDACRLADLAVPDRVALVGIDNSELMCHLADPPLTSVDVNAEQIGYEAAALLDRLARGQRLPSTTVRVPPRGVITRASTDALAVDDPAVVEALRVIRARACEPLSVEDLLKAVSVSRRTLEYRMRTAIGRTPGQEIRRVRLAAACDLLAQSDVALADVAKRVGYAELAAFAHGFRQQTGETPGQYRHRHRRVGPAAL